MCYMVRGRGVSVSGDQRASETRALANAHTCTHVRFKCRRARALLAGVIRAQRRDVAGADDDDDNGDDDDYTISDRGSAMTIHAPGVNPHVVLRSRSRVHGLTVTVSLLEDPYTLKSTDL